MLPDSDMARLACLFSPNTLEALAVRYLGISEVQISHSRINNMGNSKGFNRELLHKFKCRSGSRKVFIILKCNVIARTGRFSPKIDQFTPLRILHFTQSNSTACSNLMNFNSPLIWITIKFQIACCAIHLGNSGSKLIKEISHCAIVLAAYQETFFF